MKERATKTSQIHRLEDDLVSDVGLDVCFSFSLLPVSGLRRRVASVFATPSLHFLSNCGCLSFSPVP